MSVLRVSVPRAQPEPLRHERLLRRHLLPRPRGVPGRQQRQRPDRHVVQPPPEQGGKGIIRIESENDVHFVPAAKPSGTLNLHFPVPEMALVIMHVVCHS